MSFVRTSSAGAFGLFILAALPSLANAATATVTFLNGLTTSSQPGGTAVGNYYNSVGMTTPDLRFHISTYSGNVPFNFVDDWGAVIDRGISGPTGTVLFEDPVDFVEIVAIAQSDFDLKGTNLEPYSWFVEAYDKYGTLVDVETEFFGYGFAGTPNAPDTEMYPLADLFIRVEAAGKISRVEFSGDRKFGIDSISFGTPVPLPAAAWLFLAGLSVFGVTVRRRSVRLNAFPASPRAPADHFGTMKRTRAWHSQS